MYYLELCILKNSFSKTPLFLSITHRPKVEPQIIVRGVPEYRLNSRNICHFSIYKSAVIKTFHIIIIFQELLAAFGNNLANSLLSKTYYKNAPLVCRINIQLLRFNLEKIAARKKLY